MIDIADHMRITGLQVTNEDVDSRKAAASALKTAWGKVASVEAILLKAADVAQALGGDGTPSASLGEEVQAAVRKRASAFAYTDRPLEVGIVAGIAAAEIISAPGGRTGWLIADVWAAALWSALGFQNPLEEAKRENLRSSILSAARIRSSEGAETARQRIEVPDFGELAFEDGTESGEEAEGDAGDDLAEAFKKATADTISALRRNAALDREELDFLWWAQLGRSRLLNRPLSAMDEPVRVVAAGIEAASHLRRFPCQVHRDVVLRTLDANPDLDLSELLTAFGADRATLGAPYIGSVATRAPVAFPLLNALATGAAIADGAKVKRTVAEWGARALWEAGMFKMQSGPANL